MIRPNLAWAIALLAACGGGLQERPEPPSGAVDPGIHGLAVPGEASAPHGGRAVDPGAALLAGAPTAATALGGGAQETAGTITMTREHCDTLGRKFAELAVAQGTQGTSSDRAALEREAEGVGRTFSERCGRELVGQTVDQREYQCMLRARAPEELPGCKR